MNLQSFKFKKKEKKFNYLNANNLFINRNNGIKFVNNKL